ncbi:hypothetical protein D3C87_716050 [compost metagenome]
MNVPFKGPFSFPGVPAVMVATDVSLSVILTVAGAVPAVIAGLFVAATMVKITVSVSSATLSFNTGTLTVAVVWPAGMVTVVPIAVKSKPLTAVPLTL